jgi:hypothetical protein
VADFESVGRGFEPLLAHQLNQGFRENRKPFLFGFSTIFQQPIKNYPFLISRERLFIFKGISVKKVELFSKNAWRNEKLKIKETKCTCQACGNIWYYGKQEMSRYVGDSLQDVGKAMTCCCTGCLPAAFLPDSKPIDPSKCPKCGSRDCEKTEVEHDV